MAEEKSGDAVSMRRMMDDGVRLEDGVWDDGGVASNLTGVFDECCGELCQRELERESAVVAGAFVAFDQAADFRTPFRSQIADGKVESFRFGVRARGLSLANHEVLKSANVETEWLRLPLPGNLAGG